MEGYERLSKFTLEKVYYYPKRPNSCEKPRNKASVFSVNDKNFCEIPIINFSRVFVEKQAGTNVKKTIFKSLRKIKACGKSCSRKDLLLSTSYKIPEKNKSSNFVTKPVFKPFKAEFSKQELVKVLKRSITTANKKRVAMVF